MRMQSKTIIKKLAFRAYLTCCWTDQRFMRRFRRWLLTLILETPLNGMVIDRTVRISGVENLEMGHDVSIHWGSYLSAEGGIIIGNNVSIGHRVSLLTTEHQFSDPDVPIKFQPVIKSRVVIDDNVWIGANVTVLAGIRLRSGTVVAAGAVVTKTFDEENVILAGVPARILKRYP